MEQCPKGPGMWKYEEEDLRRGGRCRRAAPPSGYLPASDTPVDSYICRPTSMHLPTVRPTQPNKGPTMESYTPHACQPKRVWQLLHRVVGQHLTHHTRLSHTGGLRWRVIRCRVHALSAKHRVVFQHLQHHQQCEHLKHHPPCQHLKHHTRCSASETPWTLSGSI